MNGVAATGGFELALACDVLLASEGARFADTHSRVGVMPGCGLSQRLPRIIGASRAKEMSFSGRFIDAKTAAAWGIVSRTVPAGALIEEAMALGEENSVADPALVRGLKRVIDDGLDLGFSDALSLERERASAWNSEQAPGALEARRSAVIAAGRS
ncbi:MAG: enoyl-CoA hydratase-related protein [Pseudomonadota bacterium]